MAQYKTYDEETLRYLEHALYRINYLKGVFRGIRTNYIVDAEGKFNFPKFYAIAHYPNFIRKYGCADSFDSSTLEAAHKTLIKNFFR